MNDVEVLLGADTSSGPPYTPANTGGPQNRLSADRVRRVELSFNIVLSNYVNLKRFVDGEFDEEAYIIVDKSQQAKEVSRSLYTYLHNYLSSLYSYNELVRGMVKEESPSGIEIENQDMSPHIGDVPACDYVRWLAFARGLRHGLQHGEYHFLDFDRFDTKNGFDFKKLVFLQDEFESNSSVNYAEGYTQYADEDDMKLPLNYLSTFHSQYFLKFGQDVDDWMKSSV